MHPREDRERRPASRCGDSNATAAHGQPRQLLARARPEPAPRAAGSRETGTARRRARSRRAPSRPPTAREGPSPGHRRRAPRRRAERPGRRSPGSPASLTSATRSPASSRGSNSRRPLRLRCAGGSETSRARTPCRSSSFARVTRVLAEHDVGLGELAQDAQGDVLEVADRRRADRERHAYSPSSASKPIIAAPIRPASTRRAPPRRSGPRHAPGASAFACDDLPGRLEQELAGLAEAAADHDELGLEDVDEGRDPGAELPPDPCKRVDRAPRRRRAPANEVFGVRPGPEQLPRDPVGHGPGRVRLEVSATRAGRHGGPSTSITMWPSSAASRSSRGTAVRPTISPPPTPGAEREHHDVARAAADARLPLGRSPPRSRRSRSRPAGRASARIRSRRSTPSSGRFTAEIERPAPLVDPRRDPDPERGHVGSGAQLLDQAVERGEQRVLRGALRRPLEPSLRSRPRASTTAPSDLRPADVDADDSRARPCAP